MATETGLELQVSFRGKSLILASVDRNTRLHNIKKTLEELTSVPASNQKLIFKGKALHEDLETLGEAGVFQAGASPRKTRLMLVGSTSSEVEVALGPPGAERQYRVRNDLDGVAIPKGYKRVSLNYGAAPPISSPFRFVRIETLPGLPNEDMAREILESLASDPGIRTVLEKHRWTVGALCELYPEGKVGVSPRVVLGRNVNHGMKILLRLRTDDLKGFRKIGSIRKTLFHELAHNDISDHNDDFYRLMRQVENEAAEWNWTQRSGRSLGEGTGYDEPAVAPSDEGGYILVKEAFEGGSGRLGGDSEDLSHMFTAGELAARAAILRLTPEEQEVEDCCGHTHGNESLLEAATAGETPSSAATNGVEVAVPGAPRAHEGKADSPRDPGAVDAEHQGGGRSDPIEVVDVSPVSISDSGAREEARGMGPLVPDVDHGMEGVMGEAREEEGPGGGRAPIEVAAGEGASSASLVEESGVQGGGDVASRPYEARGVNTDEVDLDKMDVEPATSVPIPAIEHPLEELVAMGFPRDEAAAALAATGGSIPDAASRLVSTSSEGTQDEVAAGGEATLRSTRDVRLQQAAARVAHHHDPVAAARCADTLIGVFRNVMEHPDEEKFRRIRRSNAKFKAAVASVPGGVDVLLAAGFEERGSDQLELGRRDPGLLWLARSTVESNRERLDIRR